MIFWRARSPRASKQTKSPRAAKQEEVSLVLERREPATANVRPTEATLGTKSAIVSSLLGRFLVENASNHHDGRWPRQHVPHPPFPPVHPSDRHLTRHSDASTGTHRLCEPVLPLHLEVRDCVRVRAPRSAPSSLLRVPPSTQPPNALSSVSQRQEAAKVAYRGCYVCCSFWQTFSF